MADPSASPESAPRGDRGVPDLAWRIVEVVKAIDALDERRGAAYRALLLELWELVGNTRVIANLLGVSQPSVWESIQLAKRDATRHPHPRPPDNP